MELVKVHSMIVLYTWNKPVLSAVEAWNRWHGMRTCNPNEYSIEAKMATIYTGGSTYTDT